jgi:hypothetical protein
MNSNEAWFAFQFLLVIGIILYFVEKMIAKLRNDLAEDLAGLWRGWIRSKTRSGRRAKLSTSCPISRSN